MIGQRCLFCGGDASEPDHLLRCDGRQGHREAAETWPAFDPQSHAHRHDPDTSHAAAAAVIDATEVQQRVLTILRTPMTDEEMLTEYERRHGCRATSRYGQAGESPRKRRSDLVRLGLVEDSGERRVLSSGRSGVVWRVVALVGVLA